MAFLLKATQNVTLSVGEVRDRKRNPTRIDDPVWSSSDESVLVIAVSEDGMNAAASAVGPLGAATITLTADADLGEGVRPLTGTLDVEVVPGDASVVNIIPGVPTEQE